VTKGEILRAPTGAEPDSRSVPQGAAPDPFRLKYPSATAIHADASSRVLIKHGMDRDPRSRGASGVRRYTIPAGPQSARFSPGVMMRQANPAAVTLDSNSRGSAAMTGKVL
jgi:hypothetical protein